MAKIVLDETAHAEKLAITGTPGIPEKCRPHQFRNTGTRLREIFSLFTASKQKLADKRVPISYQKGIFPMRHGQRYFVGNPSKNLAEAEK